jgi:Tfp pilus assembly protein PilZ
MSDQRRTPRIPVNVAAEYRSSHLHADGRVVNISQGGAFFRSDVLDEWGAEARVMLNLPERNEPLELVGDVAWISEGGPGTEFGAGMGICFRDIPLADRILLANFMINRMYNA